MSGDVTIIIQDGGALGEGGGSVTPPLPSADFSVFADEPGSITSSGGIVSAWGALVQATPGDRPLLITDTETGQAAIRFSPGKTLALSDGTADFLSQEEATAIVVWRSRKWNPQLVYTILDTTGEEATAGYQFAVSDDSTNNGKYRKERIRIADGAASFIIDEPPTSGFYNNNFIEGKWVVSVLHSSGSVAEGSVDGERAWSFDETETLPSDAPSPLVVGGGYIDVACVYLKRGAFTAPQLASVVANLSSRFSAPLLSSVVGSPTIELYYAFPGLTSLDSGTLVTCYRAGLFHSGDVGTIDLKRSSDNGVSWGTSQTIQADETRDSRDPSLSKKLLSGNYLCNYFLQDIGVAGHETSHVIKSTDSTASWGAPFAVSVGLTVTGDGFEACSAPIVQRSNGQLLFPLYGRNDGEAFTSAWAVFSTDDGATWPTNFMFADGVADGISYSEPCFLPITVAHQELSIGDVIALVRDDTAGNQMWEYVWSGGDVTGVPDSVTAVPGAHSSGRSLTQLSTGEIVWCGRPNDPAASLMRRTGAGTWATGQVTGATPLGVLDAAMTYAGIVETGVDPELGPLLTIVYGREHLPSIADIVCRPNFPAAQLLAQMRMVVTPTTADVVSTETVQIVANGAGNFTYPYGQNESGAGAVSADGLYTAGAVTGTDIINVTDVNGQIKTVTIDVTGSSIVDPTGIDAANLVAWWSPSEGINPSPFPAPNIGTWTSADSSATVLTSSGSVRPMSGTSLNGKDSVDFDGVNAYFTNPDTINDFLPAGSWTIGFPFKDAGSIADTGFDFLNAAILASVTDGYFSLGTTATQVYAGQDNAGAGTPYELVAASAATAHYAIVQYDVGTGEIAISIDGSSLSAGTSVSAIGTSATSIQVGKSGVVGAYFKGSLGDLAIWKSKLAGADLTALKAFLASRI